MNLDSTRLKPEELRAQMSMDGYLVLTDVFSSTTCARLRSRAEFLVRSKASMVAPPRFTTDEARRCDDPRFFDSAHGIEIFYEDQEDETSALGGLVNKLGHALHDLDPVFSEFSRGPFFAQLSLALGIREPLLVQSMYLFKAARGGRRVDWHQDATFLSTEPQTALGFWIALEDATLENGCLQVVPGGHRQGLKRSFIRHDDDTTRFLSLGLGALSTAGSVALEVPMGSVIVLHGLLPHASAANQSHASRAAYTLHVVEGHAQYSPKNWLRPNPDAPWRGFH